jgi:hypothetical protein
MTKIINNVLTLQDGFHLYNGLVNQSFWHLTRASSIGKPGRTFPGVTLIEDGEIKHQDPYWIGYFNCLFDRINQKLKEQHNFSLVRRINRIALNAQNENHYTEFHVDQASETYSIVGFLTPQWAEEWGGELNIEGEIIKYKPGDFVLFDSNKFHKSQEIKQIPYWRVTVSYVINK